MNTTLAVVAQRPNKETSTKIDTSLTVVFTASQVLLSESTRAAAAGVVKTSIKRLRAQRQQPSFDCRKAASVLEKTICSDAELSRLDLQLGQAWIVSRGKCSDDTNCISKLYRDRLATLSGSDSAHRFSGVYEVKDIGFFALYPIGDHYLINIQTADPREGKWACELAEEAESSGDDLRVHIEKTVFQARLQDPDTLVVGDTESVSAASGQYCGLNGTFAFSFVRVRPIP